ncbi:MAG TPA: tRNA nucleotidyltransferase [Lachnospiraceae bacterium]|nr:tRNA nucleotidyltransferase [Lachnospiraceae bacterium]
MENKDLEMAEKIAGRVSKAGGRTFFVGGYVRDLLMNAENKDIDIEIHGITPSVLCEILDSLGERTEMGASFGVFGLSHYNLDIAMPRREHPCGKGHKDFEIFVDPFLGTKKAAQRRDFTINALMQDVLTGEIIDHFGGMEDLSNGVIRHVNDRTYGEDPLRVLRAAQFAARFGFRIAERTMELSASEDLTALAKERVFGETEKALLKSDTPSVFFKALRDMDQLNDWFPEIKDLIGVEQEPEFHPEGDVWNHTMSVLDAAAKLREKAHEPTYFMMAALCHDLGKTVSTQKTDGRIRSVGHEIRGVEIADVFVRRLTTETKLRKYVCNMVRLHMSPNLLADQNAGKKAFMRMFDRSCDPEDLLLLAKADRMGQDRETHYEKTEELLTGRLHEFKELMDRPFVQGRDLVGAGMEPGPEMHEALDFAHKLRLAGVPKEDALRQTMANYGKKKDKEYE